MTNIFFGEKNIISGLSHNHQNLALICGYPLPNLSFLHEIIITSQEHAVIMIQVPGIHVSHMILVSSVVLVIPSHSF